MAGSVALLAAPLAAKAQPAKLPVVGVLNSGAGPRSPSVDTTREGLRDLGYVEGQTIAFDVRFAGMKSALDVHQIEHDQHGRRGHLGGLAMAEPVPSNYSPIGSRRSPEVFVMEPTHAGHLHHIALARRLHSPWLGCVLGQR